MERWGTAISKVNLKIRHEIQTLLTCESSSLVSPQSLSQPEMAPGMTHKTRPPDDGRIPTSETPALRKGFRWHARRDSNPQPPDP